jgi:ABC-type histidine transport system ATPase subunit
MKTPTKPATGVTISVREVWKSYDGHTVLRGVRLEVAAGESLVIVGGSARASPCSSARSSAWSSPIAATSA